MGNCAWVSSVCHVDSRTLHRTPPVTRCCRCVASRDTARCLPSHFALPRTRCSLRTFPFRANSGLVPVPHDTRGRGHTVPRERLLKRTSRVSSLQPQLAITRKQAPRTYTPARKGPSWPSLLHRGTKVLRISQSPRSASLITALYGVRNIYQYSEYWELLRRPTPTDSFPIRDTR